MCVNKETYKCCACLTLTQATLILGAIYIIGAIFYGVSGSWINFIIWLITSLLFIMVLVKPHDANIRKMLFYIAAIMSLIGLACLVIFFLVYLIDGDWYKACE